MQTFVIKLQRKKKVYHKIEHSDYLGIGDGRKGGLEGRCNQESKECVIGFVIFISQQKLGILFMVDCFVLIIILNVHIYLYTFTYTKYFFKHR